MAGPQVVRRPVMADRSPLKVRVRLFGALAERAGVAEDVVEMPPGSTAGDVRAAVGERHPAAVGLLGQVSVAVNLETVSAEHPVSDGDEVGLLPPVAGGRAAILVGLRERPSVEEAMDAVAASGAGGTVVFLGTVRDRSEIGPVHRLEYSIYREMAERVLREVAEEAGATWPLTGVAILHAEGTLTVGAPTVVVACSAPHRAEAFEACRYGIDQVKQRLPVWKKEVSLEGTRWVGLREPGEQEEERGRAP